MTFFLVKYMYYHCNALFFIFHMLLFNQEYHLQVENLSQYQCLPRAMQNTSCGTGVKMGNPPLHLAF